MGEGNFIVLNFLPTRDRPAAHTHRRAPASMQHPRPRESAASWSKALKQASWDRRDEVYFEAVRERQGLREELRDEKLGGERTAAALQRATHELEVMRDLVRHLTTQQQQHRRQLDDYKHQLQSTAATRVNEEPTEGRRPAATDAADTVRRRIRWAEDDGLGSHERDGGSLSSGPHDPAGHASSTHAAGDEDVRDGASPAGAAAPPPDPVHRTRGDRRGSGVHASSPGRMPSTGGAPSGIVAVGASLEVDAAAILRECAAASAAARTAGARTAAAEAEAAALRSEALRRTAEGGVSAAALAGSLAAAEDGCASLAGALAASRRRAHAAAFARLGERARWRREERSLREEGVRLGERLRAAEEDVSAHLLGAELREEEVNPGHRPATSELAP